jgi:type IV pilus assembly protein PilA
MLHHDAHGQRGFTLIELLMVVSIIGILMAIAVPTFIGTRTGANDRAAQTLVRNLLVSARSAGVGGGQDPAQIQRDEPSLHVVAPAAEAQAGRSEVSVAVGDVAGADYVILASRSTSGKCFAVLELENAPTRYQQAPAGTCTAETFDPSTGWSDQWH